MAAAAFFEISQQVRLQIVRIRNHFTSRNLLVRRALKTELANTQTIFGAYRWAKNAAGHRARFVKFAEAGLRIENGARLVVGEVFEASRGFFSFIQQTCACIPGKFRRESGN